MGDLKSIHDWFNELEEGGAQRRAIRDSFIRQIKPPLAPANVNSGLSGPPAAVVIALKVKTDSDVKKKKKTKKKK